MQPHILSAAGEAVVIRTPTAFVLGAGASYCYHFPLGQRLCQTVSEDFREGGGLLEAFLRNTTFTKGELEEFIRELQYSGQNSIDAFLENRQEYLNIGKAIMSFLLISYEQPDLLWTFQPNNWMRYLFERMRASTLEAFSQNEVAFVTFNFDRSLEHFLFESLKKTSGASDEDVSAVLSEIPLIHLHGRLGFLPWQRTTSARAYSPEVNAEMIELSVQDIKLVHEELKDGRDKDFTEAQRLLGLAERIYLLGFGFGDVNVSRLGLPDLLPGRAVATAFGFTQHEVSSLNKKCGEKVSIYPNYNIETLFREMVIWE
jgi:hypothetical protein